MKKHRLKISNRWAENIMCYNKHYLKINTNRSFNVGDSVLLYTYEDNDPTYISVEIEDITDSDDYVVLWFKNIAVYSGGE